MANLKKHIQRKYLFEQKVTEEEIKIFNEKMRSYEGEEMRTIRKVDKSKSVLIQYNDNKFVLGFPYSYQGFSRFIPEPDPVLLYFDHAYYILKLLEPKKKELLKGLLNTYLEDMGKELYEYFGHASAFIIMLFTALETFTNRCIPMEFIYIKDVNGKRTESYSKSQVERHISFDEKVKEVFKQVYKSNPKDFAKAYPLINQRIINLKKLRDDIVHTKVSNEGHSVYDYLYKRLIDFKFVESLNAVKDFCNYYHSNPNYIEECSCDINE